MCAVQHDVAFAVLLHISEPRTRSQAQILPCGRCVLFLSGPGCTGMVLHDLRLQAAASLRADNGSVEGPCYSWANMTVQLVLAQDVAMLAMLRSSDRPALKYSQHGKKASLCQSSYCRL